MKLSIATNIAIAAIVGAVNAQEDTKTGLRAVARMLAKGGRETSYDLCPDPYNFGMYDPERCCTSDGQPGYTYTKTVGKKQGGTCQNICQPCNGSDPKKNLIVGADRATGTYTVFNLCFPIGYDLENSTPDNDVFLDPSVSGTVAQCP